MRNPIPSSKIAKENIRRKPFRSFAIVLMILLFTMSLIVGSIITHSMANGLQSAANMLGADIMVVPEGFDPHVESILLSTTPSDLYLPKDAEEKIRAVEGVDKISAQSYLATLSASCCSYPLEVIGIDRDTDFIIKPWLLDSLQRELAHGEIIIGHHVEAEVGDTLTFFGKPFKVSGKLKQTGLSLDTSVFMTRETLAALAPEAVRIKKHPLSEDGSLVSTLMVRVKPGYSSVDVSRKINELYNKDGIYALFSKKLVNELNANLDFSSTTIRTIVGFIWVLSVIVIALMYAMSFHERKKEFAVLRIIGASKPKVIAISLLEVFYQSLWGALGGAFLSAVVLLILSPVLIDLLKLPYLLPGFGVLLQIGILSMLTAMLTSMLSAVFSILKHGRKDVYENMRSNE